MAGLKQLRSLLLGEESARIRQLEQTLELWPRPEAVARALPDAINQCEQQGDALSQALGPSVTQALKVSVRKDPKPLVEALFPLLGPMIRRYIQAALAGMVQSLNQVTESSFNLGLRYRAWRSGVSVGQYVLLKNLVYRVEQVYLLHNETGLALLALEDPGTESPDPDLVSSMLTAITDFVRDSFQASESDTLEQITMGPHQILVAPGPQASLAAAVRGSAPAALTEQMTEMVENLHFRHAADLEDFEGDAEPFLCSRPDLERLLQMETQPAAGPSTSLRLAAVAVLATLLLAAGYLARTHSRFYNFLDLLDAEAGIVVTQAHFSWWGQHSITGLRDPAARAPEELANEAGLPAVDLRQSWQSYESLEPSLVAPRLTGLLNPPDTATLKFQSGVLSVSGRAPKEWMEQAKLLAAALPGIHRYDDSELEDTDPLGRIRKLLDPPQTITLVLEGKHLSLNGAATNQWLEEAKERSRSSDDIEGYEDGSVTNLDRVRFDKIRAALEEHSVYFNSGTSEFRGAASETITKAATDWKRLSSQAQVLGISISLQVTGQADATGTAKQNARLSKERASRVMNRMQTLGVAKSAMSIEAIQAEGEDPRLRRVIFLVLIR